MPFGLTKSKLTKSKLRKRISSLEDRFVKTGNRKTLTQLQNARRKVRLGLHKR
jgi:hypothetical protein